MDKRVQLYVWAKAAARALREGAPVALPITARVEPTDDGDEAEIGAADAPGELRAGTSSPCRLEIAGAFVVAVVGPLECWDPIVPLMGTDARIGPSEYERLAQLYRVSAAPDGGGRVYHRCAPATRLLIFERSSGVELFARAFVRVGRTHGHADFEAGPLRVTFGRVPASGIAVSGEPGGWHLVEADDQAYAPSEPAGGIEEWQR